MTPFFHAFIMMRNSTFPKLLGLTAI